VLDCPPALQVQGDRELIQQAVANLLDNAIKFSPDGKSILLHAAQHGGFVRIVVSDEGPGIPQADRSRAMERFFRGEMARHTPGSGLGLSLVQAVAQLHGGTLNLVANNPGLSAELELATQDVPAAQLAHPMRAASR
jgi:signal transduction histidine kinase